MMLAIQLPQQKLCCFIRNRCMLMRSAIASCVAYHSLRKPKGIAVERISDVLAEADTFV